MGGNAFDNVTSIDIDTYKHNISGLLSHLHDLGFGDIELVGSTGKKAVMGDIDIAARPLIDVQEIISRAIRQHGLANVKKSGGCTMSIAYPVKSLLTRTLDHVQVDVMMGDPRFLAWSRFGVSNDPTHPHYSRVKGAVRNVFLGTVMWWVTRELLPGEQGDLDRVRYVLDYDDGLQKLWQTLRNKRDDRPPNKNWRTTERQTLSSDPEFICRFITGESNTRPERTLLFGDIVKQLRASKRFSSRVDAMIDDFCERLSEADSRVVGNLEETVRNVRLEAMR